MHLVDVSRLVSLDDQGRAHHISGCGDVQEKDFPVFWGYYVTSRKFTQINLSLKIFFKIFSLLSSNPFWRFVVLAPKLNFRSNTKNQISVPTTKSIIV